MGGVFLVGSKSEFLKALGVKYGWLFMEGSKPYEVLSLDQGEQLLADAVEKELVTADEAQALEDAMGKAGLAKDVAAVFKKARQFKVDVPKGFTPALRFEICTSCPVPTTHGYVKDAAGNPLSEPLGTLINGFSICDDAVGKGRASVQDAVVLFRQMVEADLAVDEADWKKRYDALPEEVRRGYERTRSRRSGLSLGFEMLEIRSPDDLAQVLASLGGR